MPRRARSMAGRVAWSASARAATRGSSASGAARVSHL